MGEESGGTGRWGCTGEIRKEIEILFGKTLKKTLLWKKNLAYSERKYWCYLLGNGVVLIGFIWLWTESRLWSYWGFRTGRMSGRLAGIVIPEVSREPSLLNSIIVIHQNSCALCSSSPFILKLSTYISASKIKEDPSFPPDILEEIAYLPHHLLFSGFLDGEGEVFLINQSNANLANDLHLRPKQKQHGILGFFGCFPRYFLQSALSRKFL